MIQRFTLLAAMLLAAAVLPAQGLIPDQFAFSGTVLFGGSPYNTGATGNFPVDISVYFFNGQPPAGSTSGFVFKQDFNNQQTSTIGAFVLRINTPGVPSTGSWSSIDWLGGNVWIVVQAEINNQAVTEVARFQVLSTPYAFYADRVIGVNPDNATSGQVLKFNGTEFVPGTDNSGTTYSAGSGISIAGSTISAADASATNELQTLSISGASLTLSQNGGTVNVGPKVAILKELKPYNVPAGSVTANTWYTRALNDLDPPAPGFVTLNANQFTLQPGRYLIEAEVPGYEHLRHFAVLRRVSDNTIVIAGRVAFSATASGADQTESQILGIIDVSSATAYDIRHISSSAIPGSTTGQGVGELQAISNAQYTGQIPHTTVKITKLD